MMKNIVSIFSTVSSQYFADLIARGLYLDATTPIDRKLFGGVEHYYRLGLEKREDLIGKTAVFVGSTHTDEDINELYRVGCALAGYGATRRIFVIPFFGYSTMERAKLPGEVITAKAIARQLSSIPNTGQGNVFLMLELHVSGLVHYFEGDCLRYELRAADYLAKAVADLNLSNLIFASADMGRPALVSDFAKRFGAGIALIDKDREFEATTVRQVIGDVRGKVVVIYDDMTRTAGTIVKAALAYLECGATEVYAVLSHCALNDDAAVKLLLESPIKKIITTNSHPMSQVVKVSERFIICDVSSEFVKIISRFIQR